MISRRPVEVYEEAGGEHEGGVPAVQNVFRNQAAEQPESSSLVLVEIRYVFASAASTTGQRP